MRATLIRFGQEVDLEQPDKVVHTLVFDIGGRTMSLPVIEDTVKALVATLYSMKKEAAPTPKPPAEPVPTEEDLAHATEFGGGGTEEQEEERVTREEQDPVSEGLCPNCNGDEYERGETCTRCGFFDGPDTEDEVASL